MNLLNLDSQPLGIPDTDYPSTIKMCSNEFVGLVRDLCNLSDSVKVEMSGETAIFSVQGKAGKGSFTFKNNSAEKIDEQVTIKNSEDFFVSYGLPYLNGFAKAASLSNVVILNISKHYPLMIDYEIDEIGFLKFYLAPKMEEDNDNEAKNE